MSNNFDFKAAEAKWQKVWREEGVYEPDLVNAKNPFYNLMMFPYPSAEGLHVGNMYAFTGADIFGRYNRMQGKDVFEPIGLDGFGIHSENYAIKIGKHPKEQSKKSEENFYKQLSSIGNGYDWRHTLETYDPDYYKWTQWLFIQMFKHGLAYRGTAMVNWCPNCKTVLADEQVEAGACERCKTEVERREMASWYFRITDYAERLLENIDGNVSASQSTSSTFGAPTPKSASSVTAQQTDASTDSSNPKSMSVDTTPQRNKSLQEWLKDGLPDMHEYDPKRNGLIWPETIKTAQRNWIGKKEGAIINFQIKITNSLSELSIFNDQTNTKNTTILMVDSVEVDGDQVNRNAKNEQSNTENQAQIEVFTTRADTVFGTTFLVVAPEYLQEKMMQYVPETYKEDVLDYVENSLKKSEQDRKLTEKEKTGVNTGVLAVNPANGENIPVFVADYVLIDYGTGAVMGVPAHDERDFEFALKYELPVIRVIESKEDLPYTGEGKMVNSGKYSGMNSHEAREKITENENWAEKETNYHLRDWLISRQRYWGPPIPMIYCEKCAEEGKGWISSNSKLEARNSKQITNSSVQKSNNLEFSISIENLKAERFFEFPDSMFGWYPVPEKDLPVVLPDIEDFKPKGDGTTPLANAPDEWKYTECPNCGGKAIRELEVSDTFLDSSWYFLRYPSVNNSAESTGNNSTFGAPTPKSASVAQSHQPLPWNNEITKRWLPVNAYIGGAEHAVLHLLYSRFVTMALKDWDYLDFEEPFPFLFGHGLIIKEGAKMSKSKGNVVNPDEYIEKYGADTLRLYLMFLGPYDSGGDFRDAGIEGMSRFVNRVWGLFMNYDSSVQQSETAATSGSLKSPESASATSVSQTQLDQVRIKQHQTIKKVTEDMAQFKYNTAIAAIMEYVNVLKDASHKAKSKSQNDNQKVKNDSNLQSLVTDHLELWSNALTTLAQLLAPFAPFMTETAWRDVFGREGSIHRAKWPDFNAELAREETVTVVVQVNGKLRAQIELERGKAEDKEHVISEAKKEDNVQSFLKGEPKDTIFIPGKLVNFVV